MSSVNVYDFDGTIYDGDSSVDFFKFVMKKKKTVARRIFQIALVGVAYMLKIKEKDEFKSVFFGFVKDFDDIDILVDEFWKNKRDKIKDFYKKQHQKSDVIISASPEFLLKPVAEQMDFTLIATDVDRKTGKLRSKNCYGEEKVKRFKKLGIKINEFYSDSLTDAPLAECAQEAFMVQGKVIIPWCKYRPSLMKRIKSFIFDRSFITFVAIGCINALNGIIFALLYHSFIEVELVSYTLGFLSSVVVAYLLNAWLNFKKRLSLWDCVKYIFGNIPNYLIQILTVYLGIGILEWNRILTYTMAAIISVPVTFAIVKLNVFQKKNK